MGEAAVKMKEHISLSYKKTQSGGSSPPQASETEGHAWQVREELRLLGKRTQRSRKMSQSDRDEGKRLCGRRYRAHQHLRVLTFPGKWQEGPAPRVECALSPCHSGKAWRALTP